MLYIVISLLLSSFLRPFIILTIFFLPFYYFDRFLLIIFNNILPIIYTPMLFSKYTLVFNFNINFSPFGYSIFVFLVVFLFLTLLKNLFCTYLYNLLFFDRWFYLSRAGIIKRGSRAPFFFSTFLFLCF